LRLLFDDLISAGAQRRRNRYRQGRLGHPKWQAAMEALLLVTEHDGPTMFEDRQGLWPGAR
jgi:4'-phosphopantetheinyl transferase EntD